MRSCNTCGARDRPPFLGRDVLMACDKLPTVPTIPPMLIFAWVCSHGAGRVNVPFVMACLTRLATSARGTLSRSDVLGIDKRTYWEVHAMTFSASPNLPL